MSKPHLLWQLPALAALFVLFFIGGPDYYSARSFKAFWNLGHILFFFLLAHCLLRHWQWLRGRPFREQCGFGIALAIAFGMLIESAQYLTNSRTVSTLDIARNVVGVLCALAFSAPPALSRTSKAALQTLVIAALAVSVYPLAKALADEQLARQSFPVLSDFESALELSRWTRGTRSDAKASSGHYSLQVPLSTDPYSGIGMKYLPHDWHPYSHLLLDIYNPDADELTLTCRVHDAEHLKGKQRYSDRFNRRFHLHQGWNTLQIALVDVINAPRDRTIDIHHIRGLGCFSRDLKKSRVIYVDFVRLI